MRARNENELIAESYHKVLNELAPIMVAAGRVAGPALADAAAKKLVDKTNRHDKIIWATVAGIITVSGMFAKLLLLP